MGNLRVSSDGWDQVPVMGRGEVEGVGKAQAHFRRGKGYLEMKGYLEALGEFQKALEYDPTNDDILKEMKKAYAGIQ